MSQPNNIRMVLFDVDGIMTDGKLYYLPDGQEMKCFHVHDGMGIKQLQKKGLVTGVISARGGPAVAERVKQLGMQYCYLEQSCKLTALNEIVSASQIPYEQIAFMGDDLADKAVLQTVGYAMTVANAVPDIKAIADYETKRSGGEGAVREAAEHLLQQLTG